MQLQERNFNPLKQKLASLADTSRHVGANQERLGVRCPSIFAVKIYLSYSAGFFNLPQNLMTWGRWLYFPSEGIFTIDFYCP
jgi:hypothetical protein